MAASLTDPKGEVTTYSYDGQSNLTKMVYPNKTQAGYTFDNLIGLIDLANERTARHEKDNIQMEYAYNAGGVLVSAAGNDNGAVLYPAAYTQYGIAVGATDHNDQRAAFSNFGAEIDAAAPGVNVYSTWWDDTYTTASGTSAAAPFVSGLAGLLLSRDPAILPAEVEAKIKSTAEDEYDYENRLTGITYSDTTAAEYLYDGGGRRIQSLEDNKITKFLYDAFPRNSDRAV
jgi:YD repeat-containing protein